MTDTAKQIARDTAKILLDTKSVLFNAREPFTYTSGKKGPSYIDIRRLISFPDERKKLIEDGLTIMKENGVDPASFDLMAGGETAGIPYAAFLSQAAHVPMAYVRKKPKGFGRLAQIEGVLEPSMKTLLVEDMVTDGGSKKLFVDALRAADAVVEHIFVIFHYGIFPASVENCKEMGVQLHALCTWWDVLEVAKAENYFNPETLSSVEDFLNDPAAWQARVA